MTDNAAIKAPSRLARDPWDSASDPAIHHLSATMPHRGEPDATGLRALHDRTPGPGSETIPDRVVAVSLVGRDTGFDDGCRQFELSDRLGATHGIVSMTGVHALIRVADQPTDRARGLRTAGLIAEFLVPRWVGSTMPMHNTNRC